MEGTIIPAGIQGTNKLERLWLMSKIEFKLRYYGNRLGLIWALFKPISEILIFYVAFEMIMKQDIPYFVSFFFLALAIWNFFIECTTGTIQILATKKYLYEYTNMNKIEIYLAGIGSNLIGLAFNLIMFFIWYLFFEYGTQFTWHAIFLVPIILNLMILALAFSLILSNLYIIAKDISQVWAIVSGLAFWLSPILYKLELFRGTLPGLDYINPIAGIIINARHVVMYHRMPEWDLFGWNFLYSILFLLAGMYLLRTVGVKASEKL